MSPKTIAWYRDSFKAFENALDRTAIVERIAELRSRGVKAVSINTWLRCVNVTWRWLHVEHGKELIKTPRLKEDSKILETLSEEHLRHLVGFGYDTRNLKSLGVEDLGAVNASFHRSRHGGEPGFNERRQCNFQMLRRRALYCLFVRKQSSNGCFCCPVRFR